MKEPLISIITVVYNGVATLEQTILSVINQTYKNIEYIIIDGGSTDGTVDIIKKYEKHLACWVSEPDKGIYDAMNKSLKLVHGDFLFFLNTEDIFYKNETVDKVVMQMNNFNFVYYGNVYLSNIQKLYWGNFTKYKLAIGNICHQSIFYPRHIYTTYCYDLKYKVFADYCYNLVIFRKVEFIYLNETISFYDNRGFSTIVEDYQFKKDINRLIIENLGLCPLFCRLFYWTTLKIKKRVTELFS